MNSANRSLVADGLALIFDLDGVIIHSNPFHIAAWRTYLRQFGVEYTPEMQAVMFGRHNRELVVDLIPGPLTEEEIVHHGRRKEAIYRELLADRVPQQLVAGLPSFLEETRGTPKAVASNAEQWNVEYVIGHSGLAHHFHVLLHGESTARPKPFPDVYEMAARLLGVPPRNCIIFEDSQSGVQAARDAGARVAGLLTTHERLEGVEIAAPDFNSSDLREWLRAQEAR